MFNEKSNDQFKQDMATARSYVSAELKKHGIIVDIRLLTTISVLQSIALKFIDGDIDGSEARASFDNAITMYNNTTVPF